MTLSSDQLRQLRDLAEAATQVPAAQDANHSAILLAALTELEQNQARDQRASEISERVINELVYERDTYRRALTDILTDAQAATASGQLLASDLSRLITAVLKLSEQA